MTTKVCTKCGADKTLDHYYRRKNGKSRGGKCKSCCYLVNELSIRRGALKRRYGITVEEYNSMFCAQSGRCAVCANEQANKRLAVDHCHVTGKVRALLCDRCNRAIGLLRDDSSTMKRAIAYLEHHSQHP